MNRKQIKADAKQVVKKHYLLSVAICLVAMLFSSAFVNQMEDSYASVRINEALGDENRGNNRFSI